MKDDILLSINKKNELKINKDGNNSFFDKEISIIIIGYIYDLSGNKILANELKKMYGEFKTKFTKLIDGIYSIFIFDHVIKKGYVFQDRFGSNQHIYYYKSKDEIIISNKLKNIIKMHPNDWLLDKIATNEFIDKGFVASNRTLVKNIYKVPSSRFLVINSNGKTKLKPIYKEKITSLKKMNYNIYNKRLNEACITEIKDNDNINITISSGYDSNYLLYLLHNSSNKKINAFSVGGKIGVNETDDARKICSNYEKVNFNSKLIDGKTFMNFPEIVWALEGAVYERGIFLQYELAKMVKSNNEIKIILGDCADQVLRYELYHNFYSFLKKTKYNVKRNIKLNIRKTYFNYNTVMMDVYSMLSYIILKKNGIIMNYFDINAYYPYLRKNFLNVARTIVRKRDYKKEYHKNVINNILPKDITKMLKKIGGATEQKTLFDENIDRETIKRIAQKSNLYKKTKFSDENSETDYIIKILYVEIFKKIFFSKNIEKYFNGDFNRYNLNYFIRELEL